MGPSPRMNRLPRSRLSRAEKDRIRGIRGDLLVWNKDLRGYHEKQGVSEDGIRSKLKEARATHRRIITDGKESEKVSYAFQYLEDRLPVLVSRSDPWKKKFSMALSLYYRAISDVYGVRNSKFFKRFFNQRRTTILGMLELERSGKVEKSQAVSTLQSLITCLKLIAHWIKMKDGESYENSLRRDFDLNLKCLKEIIAVLENERGKTISLDRANSLIEGPFRSMAVHEPVFLFQNGMLEIFQTTLDAQEKAFLKGRLPLHVQEGESKLIDRLVNLK